MKSNRAATLFIEHMLELTVIPMEVWEQSQISFKKYGVVGFLLQISLFAGANMLDVSSRGINLAIISNDTSILYDAINRYFNECQYTPGTQDGNKVDGSFMQHDSQVDNGNYVADFMRTMMLLFYQTKNTSFYPPESVQEAYLNVINGSEWFMYRKNKEDDTLSPQLSWQYSVMGRMIPHRYSDWYGIKLNLDSIMLLF